MKPPAEKPPHFVSEAYVPPMGTPHRVQTGESWVSLAKSLDIDAWDLIEFNFPGMKRVKARNFQLATRFVNWYLRQYVGCERSEDGGKNYAFTSLLTGGKGSWKGARSTFRSRSSTWKKRSSQSGLPIDRWRGVASCTSTMRRAGSIAFKQRVASQARRTCSKSGFDSGSTT